MYLIDQIILFRFELYASTFIANYEYTVFNINSKYHPYTTTPSTGHLTNVSFAPVGVVTVLVLATGTITVNASNTNGGYFCGNGYYKIK